MYIGPIFMPWFASDKTKSVKKLSKKKEKKAHNFRLWQRKFLKDVLQLIKKDKDLIKLT